MQATRASRISEVEWNARRPKLEKLYLDDNLSRQEIIDVMAREDNFAATEKQLKYQFNKWGLKKYVKDRDLTAMLSVKRKRQELGKNTTFMYRGHLFEQERLERASKRHKGPRISSPELPTYIKALVSPRQSPLMTCFPPPCYPTPAVPGGIEEISRGSGGPSTLDFLSSDSFPQSAEFGSSTVSKSLGTLSDPLSFYNSEQDQANSELWGDLLDNSMTPFSPGHRSLMPTSSGQDTQATFTETLSPLVQQITSSPLYLPIAQGPHDNHFPSSNFDLDPDFSMFLNISHSPSTASSPSRPGLHPHRSVESISISAFQPTDRDDTYMENREFDIVSMSAAVAGQTPDPVTNEDSGAEKIISLLISLKNLAFPQFDPANQKYGYEDTMLSDIFCSHCCESLCFDFEELLELYREGSPRSIRARRAARIQSSLPTGYNLSINEHRQGPRSSRGSQRPSKGTVVATGATKMQRRLFRRCCSTPMGVVVFQVEKEPRSPMGDEENASNQLISISFMPLATRRTLGLCVRLSGMMSGPPIAPQINTFNVVPKDSAIIRCVINNDLRGVQSLFDLGAASARDVDPLGLSLLWYAMFTGCSDIFRLLAQGGASFQNCWDSGRTTDIVSSVWEVFLGVHSGLVGWRDFFIESIERVKDFEQCVAISKLALDNNCTIDSADDRIPSAGPLFSLVGFDETELHASTLIKVLDYLLSIGWDFEEKNCIGQTPLLFAAAACGPQVAACLRAVIENGARLDARDVFGRGPLLNALSPGLMISDWIDLTYVGDSEDSEDDYRDNNWDLSQTFRTEDRRHALDYYGTESILDPVRAPASPEISQSTASLDGLENSPLAYNQESSIAAEQPISGDSSVSDLDSNASLYSDDSISRPEDDDYVYCFNYEGDRVRIRNPVHVLKDRVRIKLKILLEAGCDPNDVDYDGESANDYARRGLWPQWLWALERTGYVFDKEHDRWIKRIDTA